MENEITPELLARFIEYAATNRVTAQEWNRFAATHYQDPRLERARHECVRLLIGQDPSPLDAEIIDRLYELADELRKLTKDKSDGAE